MNYEQKYKDALERAKQALKDGTITNNTIAYIQDIFPELKESCSNRIKNLIYCLIRDSSDKRKLLEHNGTTVEEAPAWLEKQGEPKPQGKTALEAIHEEKVDNQNCVKLADKVEPKFHKGDWVVVSTTKGEKVVQIASVEYLKGGYPSYITTEGRWFGNGTKARLLTDKDVGTITLPESKVIVKQKTDGWSEEDEKMLGKCIDAASGYYDPKEKDSMKSWLESLRPRTEMIEALRTEYEKGRADALSEMKSSWDEEDKEMLNLIINIFEVNHPNGYFKANELNDPNMKAVYTEEIVAWLKSLKQRYNWKPSKEQMDALDYYANSLCTYCDRQDDLRSLFNVIKKL